MKRFAVLNIVGLTPGLLARGATPLLSRFVERNESCRIDPALPAVTCTAQATYLCGTRAEAHGIVGNGWYDRALAETQFWKQSNHLVAGEKPWESLRKRQPDFTCAKLFWWYNMYSGADYSVTPRPLYPADGGKIFDVYTHPMKMREAIKSDLGPFPFHTFWGPMAGIDSSRWIADSARWVEKQHRPTLSLVYLPHLDYNLQRLGPGTSEIDEDLRAIDSVAGELIEWLEARGVEAVVLSEYGISEVDRPVHLNRVFRKEGWITVKEDFGREYLDCGASRAFALADHQVAHIYVADPKDVESVAACCRSVPGVGQVLDRSAQTDLGINHSRGGDLVVFSDHRSWFTYYYWEHDDRAPDYARTVDIHRKPGYDPVELFFDERKPLLKTRLMIKLAAKKAGFRTLMDVVPLRAELVKGSHGRRPENRDEWPMIAGNLELDAVEVPATGVNSILRKWMECSETTNDKR